MQSSLTEVARVAGVSASTVSRYVRGQLRVTPETEDKILHAMDKVGWERPCDSYTSITSVSLIIPELTNPFFTLLADQVVRTGRERGIDVFLHVSNGVASREVELIRNLNEDQHVHGILFVGSNSLDGLMDPRLITKPFIMVDEEVFDSAHNDLCLISCDNRNGAYQAINHLVSSGHSRIAFVGGRSELPTARARETGFREAMAFHGCTVDDRLVFHGPFSEAFGASILPSIIQADPLPTAVFTTSDIAAIGILSTAERFSLRIPEDLSIVSCDDINLCDWLRPRLTSIHQPIGSMAKGAFDTLFAISAGKRAKSQWYPMKLIIRSSVRAIEEN